MSDKPSSSAGRPGGIGFLALLTILFIALKLTGIIAWPWGAVLMPLWFPILIYIFIILIACS